MRGTKETIERLKQRTQDGVYVRHSTWGSDLAALQYPFSYHSPKLSEVSRRSKHEKMAETIRALAPRCRCGAWYPRRSSVFLTHRERGARAGRRPSCICVPPSDQGRCGGAGGSTTTQETFRRGSVRPRGVTAFHSRFLRQEKHLKRTVLGFATT